jgi:outer membrane protein TolC
VTNVKNSRRGDSFGGRSRRRYGRSGLRTATLLCGALFALGAPAQESKTIECDLQGCLDRAFENHPAMKAGQAREQNAEALVGSANADRLPSVDFAASLGYVTGNRLGVLGGADEGTVLESVNGSFWRAAVGAEAPLIQKGSFLTVQNHTQKKAELNVTAEQWRTKSVRSQVGIEVANAYFDVLKHRKALKIYEQYVKLGQSSYDLAQAKFNQNLLSKNDLLIAEVRVASAKRDYSIVQIAGERSQRALCSAIGLDETHQINVQEPELRGPSMESADTLAARAKENDPRVKALQYSILAQQEATKEAQSLRYPDLSFAATWAGSDDFSPPVAHRWVGALRLKVPIFDFGRTRERVAASKAKELEEERNLDASRLKVGQDIYDKYFAVRQLEIEMDLLEKQVEQGKEALKLKQAMFEQGLSSVSEVDEAQTDLLRLQLTQVRDEYDAALARFIMTFLSSGE